MSDEGLQWFYTSFTSWWGGLVSSPGMSPSQAMVWDLLHFPLVAPPVPPRYTFPNSSLDSCLAWTSNVVHASLAMPPLKNLHLRHSQMAAARSWVGPNCGSHARHATWGKQDLLQPCQSFFCSHLWGGILNWTQVMLWDVDLNHQSGSCFQHHVKGLGVTNLGQG